MKFLPVSVNISGKRILIAGGGNAAAQKAEALARFTKNIVIVAPVVSSKIKRLGLHYKIKPYACGDLRGVSIVYACTNDRKLNARIRADAHKKGIMVNVADDPDNCDFISPAVYKKGGMSVAVSSDGKNVKRAILWRGEIKNFLARRSLRRP